MKIDVTALMKIIHRKCLDCLYPNEVNSVWVPQKVAENGLPELLEDLEAYDE